MENTPNALRKYVLLLGHTNSGKSTLFNALTGQERSIVSAQPGTTTDAVQAAMELIPYGPIVLVDTAGLGDESALGAARMRRTALLKRRADAALYVAAADDFAEADYQQFRRENLPHLLVFSKADLVSEPRLAALRQQYPQALWLSYQAAEPLAELRRRLAELLASLAPEERTIVGDLLAPGSVVLLVAPIDSAAPKGRLILPQVQLLRDCLDHGIKCLVSRELELESALADLRRLDLVVTDSQVFGLVSRIVPPQIALTSFSLLLARQKGNFQQLLAGAAAIEALPAGSKVLILEGCTHNQTHEDIARVKIPALLQRKLGRQLEFEFRNGYDFPEDLRPYSLAVQCGNCMLNRREVLARLQLMAEQNLPVTNFGIILAWLNGILERSTEIFRRAEGGV